MRMVMMARERERKARTRVVSVVRKWKRGWREGMLVGAGGVKDLELHGAEFLSGILRT